MTRGNFSISLPLLSPAWNRGLYIAWRTHAAGLVGFPSPNTEVKLHLRMLCTRSVSGKAAPAGPRPLQRQANMPAGLSGSVTLRTLFSEPNISDRVKQMQTNYLLWQGFPFIFARWQGGGGQRPHRRETNRAPGGAAVTGARRDPIRRGRGLRGRAGSSEQVFVESQTARGGCAVREKPPELRTGRCGAAASTGRAGPLPWVLSPAPRAGGGGCSLLPGGTQGGLCDALRRPGPHRVPAH